MRKKIDFDLIDELLVYLQIKNEEEFKQIMANENASEKEKTKARNKHFNQNIWFTQYTKVENYLKRNPSVVPKDISNDDLKESFNPKSWMSTQKGMETRYSLAMSRKHLLAIMDIPLNQVTYEDYLPYMFQKNNLVKKIKRKIKGAVK